MKFNPKKIIGTSLAISLVIFTPLTCALAAGPGGPPGGGGGGKPAAHGHKDG